MPRHGQLCLGMIVPESDVYFVTKYTLIYVTLDAQGIMPGHDRNKNQCGFCNIVLARVSLSSINFFLKKVFPYHFQKIILSFQS